MSYWVWYVTWYTSCGEECIEEFNTKEDAQNFIKYNQWGKNEHPKLKEIEVDK